MSVGISAGSAFAVSNSTNVSASLRDDLPATLSVTLPLDGSTVDGVSVSIGGNVHNIGQIMIYVDSVYYSTVPLVTGANTFTVPLIVAGGQHILRVVGTDPRTNTQVESSVTFTYVPSQPSAPIETPTDTPDNSVSAAGIVLQNQATQASTWGPMKALSDISYQTLRAFDLVSVKDGTGVNTMTGRFAFVTSGLAVTVMPWSSYMLLSRIKLVPARSMITPTISRRMRIVGIALTVFPFLFLS